MELYRKSELKKLEKNPNENSYKYAYVTFKSMGDVNMVLEAYNVSKAYKFFVLRVFPSCCCSRRRK